MKYLLDANVLIEAYRTYYGLDFCPGYWDTLQTKVLNGEAGSIKKVYEEIVFNNDDLSCWLKSSFTKKTFANDDSDPLVAAKYLEVSSFIMSASQFKDYAKRNFLQPEEADPWICAYASVHECTVVTQEIYSPSVQRRIPLPNVLREFSVSYINTFEFLRSSGVRLVCLTSTCSQDMHT